MICGYKCSRYSGQVINSSITKNIKNNETYDVIDIYQYVIHDTIYSCDYIVSYSNYSKALEYSNSILNTLPTKVIKSDPIIQSIKIGRAHV